MKCQWQPASEAPAEHASSGWGRGVCRGALDPGPGLRVGVGLGSSQQRSLPVSRRPAASGMIPAEVPPSACEPECARKGRPGRRPSSPPGGFYNRKGALQTRNEAPCQCFASKLFPAPGPALRHSNLKLGELLGPRLRIPPACALTLTHKVLLIVSQMRIAADGCCKPTMRSWRVRRRGDPQL